MTDLKPNCFPNYNFKDDRCILCFARLDCMLEYYRLRELEAREKNPNRREPGEEVDWNRLGTKAPHCLGAYMDDEFCEECPFILDCKEATDQATGEKVRDTGKYKGTGKHRKKDKA